jgi:hypothetical protein
VRRKMRSLANGFYRTWTDCARRNPLRCRGEIVLGRGVGSAASDGRPAHEDEHRDGMQIAGRQTWARRCRAQSIEDLRDTPWETALTPQSAASPSTGSPRPPAQSDFGA